MSKKQYTKAPASGRDAYWLYHSAIALVSDLAKVPVIMWRCVCKLLNMARTAHPLTSHVLIARSGESKQMAVLRRETRGAMRAKKARVEGGEGGVSDVVAKSGVKVSEPNGNSGFKLIDFQAREMNNLIQIPWATVQVVYTENHWEALLGECCRHSGRQCI